MKCLQPALRWKAHFESSFSDPVWLCQPTAAAEAEFIGSCFQAARDLFVQLERLYLFNVPQGVLIMISVLIKSISGL